MFLLMVSFLIEGFAFIWLRYLRTSFENYVIYFIAITHLMDSYICKCSALCLRVWNAQERTYLLSSPTTPGHDDVFLS